jgi:spectinomycin phosphotransferase
MLEKPDISESLISSCLHDEYGLEIDRVTFLPIGYDIHTAVYRVDAHAGIEYFLKLRKDPFNPITVAIPQFLSSFGIQSIFAPLYTLKGRLFGKFEDYTTILYSFIPGKDGYQMELTDQHWIELGRCLKMVHIAQIPLGIAMQIPHEVYDSQWRESVKQFQTQVENVTFDDPIAEKLSAFMKHKRQEISHMVRRADELAEHLQHQAMDFVLCHSDAHPGNYLISDHGELYLVDWDNPIFAPRERDLMFFGSGMSGYSPGGREEGLFYQGYGPVEINRDALSYYRYERIIQDISEFCKQLLLTSAGGEDRLESYKYFVSSFSQGNEVEVAFNTDPLSSIR